MDRSQFQESLLQVMEHKRHWAWPIFTKGGVSRQRLHIHLEQEYEVYVRDYPTFLGRAFVQCPIPSVRRALAEHLYEEETGRLSLGTPHPELFLELPNGLGMQVDRFRQVELLPAARQFRSFLDAATNDQGWEIATVVSTIFLAGNAHERGELEPDAARRPTAPLDRHPLVRHYDLPVECLALTRAHRMVDDDHRATTWRAVLDSLPPSSYGEVICALLEALDHWHDYRDEVANACGLSPELLRATA